MLLVKLMHILIINDDLNIMEEETSDGNTKGLLSLSCNGRDLK
jgi:hypothetical protein